MKVDIPVPAGGDNRRQQGEDPRVGSEIDATAVRADVSTAWRAVVVFTANERRR